MIFRKRSYYVTYLISLFCWKSELDLISELSLLLLLLTLLMLLLLLMLLMLLMLLLDVLKQVVNKKKVL